MLAELTLSYTRSNDPTDSFDWLSASAVGTQGARSTGCWVQWQDLVEWAEQLRTSAVPVDGITVDWGFEVRGTWYGVVHVDLSRVDPSTGATARISLRDYDDPAQLTEIEFEADDAAIRQFGADLARMMARECDSVTLRGA
jgi:hypothetical protein